MPTSLQRFTDCSISSGPPPPPSEGSGPSQSFSTGRSARRSCLRSPRRSAPWRRFGGRRAPRPLRCAVRAVMGEVYFFRALWVALLPVAIWLIWQVVRGRSAGGGWRALVDPKLRAYVLAEPEVLRESRWPLIAL